MQQLSKENREMYTKLDAIINKPESTTQLSEIQTNVQELSRENRHIQTKLTALLHKQGIDVSGLF